MISDSTATKRTLERPVEGRVVAGVAAGFAAFLDLDVVIVRAVLVGLTFVSGLGVALYLGAWAMLAESGASNTVPAEVRIRTWCRG
jgi:phage shock protein PspC (stress-responsive transcriptional regulator)